MLIISVGPLFYYYYDSPTGYKGLGLRVSLAAGPIGPIALFIQTTAADLVKSQSQYFFYDPCNYLLYLYLFFSTRR